MPTKVPDLIGQLVESALHTIGDLQNTDLGRDSRALEEVSSEPIESGAILFYNLVRATRNILDQSLP